jgi:hypothetical protein
MTNNQPTYSQDIIFKLQQEGRTSDYIIAYLGKMYDEAMGTIRILLEKQHSAILEQAYLDKYLSIGDQNQQEDEDGSGI